MQFVYLILALRNNINVPLLVLSYPFFLIGFCMQNNLIWGFCEFSVTNPNCLQPR